MKYTIKLSELTEVPCKEYLDEFVNEEIDILEAFKKLGQQFLWLLKYETKGLKSDEAFCKLAVQQDGWALRYVKVQTEEICKLAVQQGGYALQYVKVQTEEICKLAVQQDGHALNSVTVQTEEICKLAVQENGYALQYVKDEIIKNKL